MNRARPSSLIWIFSICAAIRCLAIVPFIIDDDEAWWAASARWLQHPWDFYFKVPDDKTPGCVWFCWVVRQVFENLGTDPRVIRAAFIALTIGAALLLGKIAEQFTSQTSSRKQAFWVSSILFLVASALPSPKLLAFTSDGLMLLFVIAGYALALSIIRSPARCFLAGAFLGGGLLVKQTAVFAALPLLFSQWPFKWRGREIAWMAAGAGAVLIPSVWALGFSEMSYWVWTYPREVLTSVRATMFSSNIEFLSNTLIFFLALLPLVRACFRFQSGAPRLLVDFRIQWLLSSLLIVLVGKGLFLHYFLMSVPPLALILTEVFSRRTIRAWESLWLGLGYATSCVLVTVPALEVSWGTDLPYFSRLNAAIARALPKDQGILVWGGSPLPLVYSGARPVTRFILPRYAVKPYGTERMRQIFYQELAQDPPAVVIDLHERGDNRFSSPIESEPAIDSLVRGYHLYIAPAVPWAKLYFRAPPPPSAGLMEIRSLNMKDRIYSPYPSLSPAWKVFEKAVHRPPSLSVLSELRRINLSTRNLHALELVALQGRDEQKRSRAFSLVQKLKQAGDEQRPSLEAEVSEFLNAPTRENIGLLPLSAPEWWFTVSLAQMQPRAIPSKGISELDVEFEAF